MWGAGGGERERERERERNIDVRAEHRSVASCTRPDQESKPRYVPHLGIEFATLWCTGQHSNRLSHPAMAVK